MAVSWSESNGRRRHRSPEDSNLRISLFGCPKVFRPGRRSPVSLGRPTQRLLAFLLLHGAHIHPREKVASALWPQSCQDAAAHSLRTTLWRLRQAIEPSEVPRGTYLVVTPRGEVGFNWESVFWLDVFHFEDAISTAGEPSGDSGGTTELVELEGALRLYEGELLEGYFDDWILRERERLRRLYIQGATHAMRRLGDEGRYEQALACGCAILGEDPLYEVIHRHMMRLYVLSGNRGQALLHYEQFAHLLQAQLEVQPTEETTSLYVEILQLEPRTTSSTSDQRPLTSASKVAGEYRQCLEELEQCHELLRRTREKLCALALPLVREHKV